MPDDFISGFIKSVRLEFTKDEKPLLAFDDYVSLALIIPLISQLSSGPMRSFPLCKTASEKKIH